MNKYAMEDARSKNAEISAWRDNFYISADAGVRFTYDNTGGALANNMLYNNGFHSAILFCAARDDADNDVDFWYEFNEVLSRVYDALGDYELVDPPYRSRLLW